jgi:hypothetical protein
VGLHAPWKRREKMYKIVVGKVKGKDRWEDLDADGRIMLKWIVFCELESSDSG